MKKTSTINQFFLSVHNLKSTNFKQELKNQLEYIYSLKFSIHLHIINNQEF